MTTKKVEKKKMGRPVVGLKKDTRVTIRLDDDMFSSLESYCAKSNVSMSDAIREALSHFFK